MQVRVSINRKIIVYDQIDSLNIDSSTEKVGSNQQTRSVSLEEVIIFNSFLLFEGGVDADWVEKLLFEELGEFFGSVNAIDEDDSLVEGKSI